MKNEKDVTVACYSSGTFIRAGGCTVHAYNAAVVWGKLAALIGGSFTSSGCMANWLVSGNAGPR